MGKTAAIRMDSRDPRCTRHDFCAVATSTWDPQSRITAPENVELQGVVSMASLDKASQAMKSRLVYVLVPFEPQEDMVDARVSGMVRWQLARTQHTMMHDSQAIDEGSTVCPVEQHLQVARCFRGLRL